MFNTVGGIHWRAPAVMLLSFVVAVGIAIGHHLFYASLDGQEVVTHEMSIVGLQTTRQQVNIFIGTLLAFLFKAAIAIAASTAYMQIFFRIVVGQDECKMGKLDNMFSGSKDLLSFAYLVTYYRYTLLAVMALTIWYAYVSAFTAWVLLIVSRLLPLTAVFSTAALTVRFGSIPPGPPVKMPAIQPAYASLAFVDFIPKTIPDRGLDLGFTYPRSLQCLA